MGYGARDAGCGKGGKGGSLKLTVHRRSGRALLLPHPACRIPHFGMEHLP